MKEFDETTPEIMNLPVNLSSGEWN